MRDILVRRVPTAVINGLKRRAARSRRSLQQQIVDILAGATGYDRMPAEIAARIRARLFRTGRKFTDSTPLIRKDRGR